MKKSVLVSGLLGLACSSEAPIDHAPGAELNCGVDAFAFSQLEVGDVSLNVACQGHGRTAVLLHGYPEFHLAWEQLAGTLAASGYRVVAPDQRGFNLSQRPLEPEAYHIDHLVDDASALIEAVADEPVLLIAHDWGGVVAWVLAHRRPELLRKLVVMNGPHPDAWMRPDVDPILPPARC